MKKYSLHSLRYLEPEHFRVLLAIEMGMKNHELVPLPLISSIASVHRGAASRALSDLIKLALIAYERGKRYDGYRLTNLGYDYLALRALCTRDVVSSVGNQIGVGKESDVYIGGDVDMNDVVLKFHRLGRTCFRKLKEKRDYHERRHYCSWLYLSRIAALKEFSFLKALSDRNFPVPRPIDICRHTVVMGLVDGLTLCHVYSVEQPGRLYDRLMQIIVRLAAYGIIHGDINEFNIILTKDEEPVIIDFPQMVSIEHENAEFYFDRDVGCVRDFFRRRLNFEGACWPRFGDVERRHSLDVELAASGFTKKMQLDLNKAYDTGNFKIHEEEQLDENLHDYNNDNEEEEQKYDYETEEESSENEHTMKTGTVNQNLDANNAEDEQRRLQRDTRLNEWLEVAKSRLELAALDESMDNCSLLVEMGANMSKKYLEAYEKVSIELKKYENFDDNVENNQAEQIGNSERASLEGDNKAVNNKGPVGRIAEGRRSRACSILSSSSTIAPEEIKRRLLKEKSKVKKERLKTKGKQCAVNRGRRDNMHVIKECQGWDCY